MTALALHQIDIETNENYCAANLSVSACGTPVTSGGFGEHGGCIFKVGNDMYFVPTQQVAEEDVLYITCDAQKIEGPLEGWRSRLALGDVAEEKVEGAIVHHLFSTDRSDKGDSFIVTRDGKTFRL